MLHQIAAQFDLQGRVKEIDRLGAGLINDTYRIETQEENTPDYVLQRINHAIFKDVDLLQENIARVTDEIRAKLRAKGAGDIERKALQIILTKEGKKFYYDGENYWRVMVLIPRCKSYEEVTPLFAYYTGKAFGEFHAMLKDIPSGEIRETIPKFHNMEYRLEQFKEAIAANAANRLEKAQWLVDELLSRATEMCKAEHLYRTGELPKRISHCDTKVNNILFDESGKVLCVIDLDTTMPGFVLSDFGDFMRTAGNTAAEDEADTTKIGLNMEIFREFTKGYLESAKDFLTDMECKTLPFGAKLLTYMQTVRFLGDYINGDTYYKTKHAEHNWERSLAQFTLLKSIEAHEKEMNDYINSLR